MLIDTTKDIFMSNSLIPIKEMVDKHGLVQVEVTETIRGSSQPSQNTGLIGPAQQGERTTPYFK
jgi:hypothetical protein